MYSSFKVPTASPEPTSVLKKVELENVVCDYCGEDGQVLTLKRSVCLEVRECEQCGLAYVTPRPTLQSMCSHYRDTYAVDNLEGLWGDYRSFDFTGPDIARLRRFVNLKGATVLDVGCGSGIFLDALRRAGASVLVGIEPSGKKAHLADRMVQGAKIYGSLYEEIELPESSFDLITALDIVEHLYRPGDFFRFASRLLRPGGVLFIKTPNWNAAKRYGTLWAGLNQDAEHVYYFGRRSLENYLVRVGILLEEVDYESISAGLGSTKCAPSTRSSVVAQKVIHLARLGLRNFPIVNKIGYRMLYLLRRAKNRDDIISETAHELIAVGRKNKTSD